MRQEILAAATRLFAARGVDATPLQEIADAVGVSKPAVLHHFPSKEDLRRGVLDDVLAHWRDELPRLLLAATASEDRFDRVLGEVYGFFAASPARARFIAREALDRPVEARAALRRVAPLLAGIAGYVRTGIAGGRHHDDVDADAYLLLMMQLVIAAAAVGDVTAEALGAGAAGRARYDQELTRLARAGLFARPRRNP